MTTPELSDHSRDSRDATLDHWHMAALASERQAYELLHDPYSRQLMRLSLLQLDLITQLPEAGGSVAEMAEAVPLDKGAVSLEVTRLVRRGLLRRQRTGGRVWVQRTESGDQVMEALRSLRRRLLANMMEKIPPSLQPRMAQLMAALAPSPDQEPASKG
ncbi:MAG: hypothetical protein ACREN7_07195 [Candidatus Dormibacteria bacterium]